MSREGWKTYRENAELPAGFVFDQTGVRPVNDDVLAEDRFTNIPVKVLGGEVVGSLAIFDDPHHPTAPEDYEFLQQVSDQIALALEGARLSSQTQSALAQSEKLFEASRLLTQSTDLQELVKSSVEILNIPVVNRASLGIFNYNADGELESMTDIANWWNGTGHEVAAIGTSYSAKTLKLVSAFLSATPVFFNDTFNDERMGEGELQIIKRLNIRAIAVLPLYLGARQIGVLRLQAEEPHNFSQEETRLYAALAPQVATVVENRRQYQEAQSKAERESMLNVISQKIQSATTVEAVLQIAARELGHALGAPMTVAQLSMKDKQ
jgi:GAF domain-containing protein